LTDIDHILYSPLFIRKLLIFSIAIHQNLIYQVDSEKSSKLQHFVLRNLSVYKGNMEDVAGERGSAEGKASLCCYKKGKPNEGYKKRGTRFALVPRTAHGISSCLNHFRVRTPYQAVGVVTYFPTPRIAPMSNCLITLAIESPTTSISSALYVPSPDSAHARMTP